MESDALLRHIRHAEEWLRRARADWGRGNASGALLRLMLAEAEIRHAREDGAVRLYGFDDSVARGESAGAGRDVRPARTVRAAAAVAAAVVLAGGIGYASFRAAELRREPIVAHDAPPAPVRGRFDGRIVQLDSGQFLMPDRGQDAAGGRGDRSLQFAVPVDLRTPSPTF